MSQGIKKQPKAEGPISEPETQADSPKPEVSDSVSAITEVSVFDTTGQFVRTYSLSVHGSDFQKLADEFVAGHPGCYTK